MLVALWHLWHCPDHNADRLVHLGMLHVYEPVLLDSFLLVWLKYNDEYDP